MGRSKPFFVGCYLIVAGRIIALTARSHGAAPIDHILLVLRAAAGVICNSLVMLLGACDVFVIGACGAAGRAPALRISGVTFADHGEFLPVELANDLAITGPGGCAAHRWIVGIVRQNGGRHYCSGNRRAC